MLPPGGDGAVRITASCCGVGVLLSALLGVRLELTLLRPELLSALRITAPRLLPPPPPPWPLPWALLLPGPPERPPGTLPPCVPLCCPPVWPGDALLLLLLTLGPSNEVVVVCNPPGGIGANAGGGAPGCTTVCWPVCVVVWVTPPLVMLNDTP
jgi:hypothetical protein